MAYSLIFCSYGLLSPASLFFFPLHLPLALLLSSVFWCNWGGGGAQFSPTAKSPESKTSNQWCQQLTLCSAAAQTLKRGPTLWTRVMIVWAPDTQITLISAKRPKAGAIKYISAPTPLLLHPQSLFSLLVWWCLKQWNLERQSWRCEASRYAFLCLTKPTATQKCSIKQLFLILLL